MNIGYARVSTGLQNLDLQKDSLKKYDCEKIFTDHMSGRVLLRSFENNAQI
ncbi:recombinase family protein [Lactococcus lactis]|uniref:recombinase family protein n=1 Tax=Lactococcus lactis TaxID=1358 RepID=UPI0025A06A9A|nr:recombinase family protein [Lactococcus lactis]MDM7538440.1 recombinase family protein [Lactococcus lactis]